MLPAWVRDVDRQARQVPIVEHRLEPPLGDVVVDDVARLDKYPKLLERGRPQDLPVVGFEQALNWNDDRLRASGEGQLVWVVRIDVQQQRVAPQISRMHWSTMALEVGR